MTSAKKAPPSDEVKPWPSREEFLASFPFNTTYSYGTAAMCYDVLTAHAMPEMCVDGMPDLSLVLEDLKAREAATDWGHGRVHGIREAYSLIKSRLKPRSVSEVREEEEKAARSRYFKKLKENTETSTEVLRELVQAERALADKLAEIATEVFDSDAVRNDNEDLHDALGQALAEHRKARGQE